ncbi:RNA polymerase sigma factor [Paenibacillus aceti]|uniref:RNA polymerase sigma factor n=1 Tax=Paenibacillus aceti TaxID=1820010 RepID=A0ABQ1VP52_9BACL|nr:sigma-70 family RNA polymerase sigma factor [Paenibacillus aceti]GGF86175.1 RNA polymerase sigma factor [Paenibacillus aceti]
MDLQNEEMSKRLLDMCEGSVEAFDEFYGYYSPFVMQVAVRMLGERMEAEDICHEVFLEVLRRGKQYDACRGSIKAWLAVMTRSRCLDRLRRSQRIQYVEEDQLDPAEESQEEIVISRLEREALRAAVYTLPDAQKKAIIGSYYAYQTQRQMSEAWNVPIGTVKSWVRYGISNLRKQLERQGWAGTAERREQRHE